MNFLLTVVLLALPMCFVHGLTADEVAQFHARTHVERNTNKQGTVSVTDSGDNHVFNSNVIPDHDTGEFPSEYNPNDLKEMTLKMNITKNPTKAVTSSCLPLGTIGMTINGISIFNPFTNKYCDAVNGEFKETFDLCGGHPSPEGGYHYHGKPNCLFTNQANWTQPDVLLGVAIDGYPIYGPIDSNNTAVTSADLDECHGRTDADGKYRYRFTTTYPYFLGCFRGNVDTSVVFGRRSPPPDSCKFATNVDEPNKYCESGASTSTAAFSVLVTCVLSALSSILYK